MSWGAIDSIREAAGLAHPDMSREDAFTADEYAKRYGLPITTARGQLARLVATGKLAKGNSTRRDSRGRLNIMVVFWVP